MSPNSSYDEPRQPNRIRNFADRVKASNEHVLSQCVSDGKPKESLQKLPMENISLNVLKKSNNVLKREVHRKSRQENVEKHSKSMKRSNELKKITNLKGHNLIEINSSSVR